MTSHVLSVHLLPLALVRQTLDETLDVAIDKQLDVVEMIGSLTAMFERVVADDAQQVNVPLSVDLTLNWLLNVYDRSVAV